MKQRLMGSKHNKLDLLEQMFIPVKLGIVVFDDRQESEKIHDHYHQTMTTMPFERAKYVFITHKPS